MTAATVALGGTINFGLEDLRPAFDRKIETNVGRPLLVREVIGYFHAFVEAGIRSGFIRSENLEGKSRETVGWVVGQPIRIDEAREDGFASVRALAEQPLDLIWHAGAIRLQQAGYTASTVQDREMFRFILNAARKLPILLDNFNGKPIDTLKISQLGHKAYWRGNTVESMQPDGTFVWGQFPWGGGVIIVMDGWAIPAAVSGFHPVEDDWLARALGNALGLGLKYEGITEIRD